MNCWKPYGAISSQANQEWLEGSTHRLRSPERMVKTHERRTSYGMMICADLTGNCEKWEIKNSCGNNVDSLSAVAANRQVEGDDATGQAPTEPTRNSNYTQISRAVVVSSGSAEAVNWAGRKSAQAYQMAEFLAPHMATCVENRVNCWNTH